jgi:hypothetical protein
MRDVILFLSCIMVIVIVVATIGFVAMWRERNLKD